MRRFWTLVVSGAMTVGVAFGGLAAVSADPRSDGPVTVIVPLDCPEEDSCDPDYDGTIDRWVITRP